MCVYIGCVLLGCADCMLVCVSGFYLVSVGLVVFVQLYSEGEPSRLTGAPVFNFFRRAVMFHHNTHQLEAGEVMHLIPDVLMCFICRDSHV